MTSLVVRRVISWGVPKLRLVRVGPKVISEGVIKLERGQVICPACGQQVEAVASEGRVRGYCAVAKQHVDFLIERQQQSTVKMGSHLTAENKAKISAAKIGKHPTAETKAKISVALKRWHNRERLANGRPS